MTNKQQNLRGNPLPPVMLKNQLTLDQGVKWNKPGYQFRCVKAQDPEFSQLYNKYPYFGLVPVNISHTPTFHMFSYNDDFVAQTYLYYGQDSYESLSVYLYAQLSAQASLVLDVGSYTGLFSLAAASKNKTAAICAYEPVDMISDRIDENVRYNGFENVEVINKAISGSIRTDVLKMYGFTGSTTGSSIAHKDKNVLRELEIEVVTLDSEIEGRGLDEHDLVLIKLDTEKDEINALSGGRKLLSEHKCCMFVEVLDDAQLSLLMDFFSPIDYSVGFIDDAYGAIHWLNSDTAVASSIGKVSHDSGRFSIDEAGYGNLLVVAPGVDKAQLSQYVEGFARRYAG